LFIKFISVITGGIDYSKIINPDCNSYTNASIKTSNVNINLDTEQTPVLKINLGPENITYSEFIKEGYSKLRDEPSKIQNSIIEAKSITIRPQNEDVLSMFYNFNKNIFCKRYLFF
jgi:hypothetical protein